MFYSHCTVAAFGCWIFLCSS